MSKTVFSEEVEEESSRAEPCQFEESMGVSGGRERGFRVVFVWVC